jgi:Xaa-Pro dipeptidase
VSSKQSKRAFLKGLGGAAAITALAPSLPAAGSTIATRQPAGGLQNIASGAMPISAAERKARIAKAQQLLRQQGLGALLLEPGSSMMYFTGIRWGRSERLTAVVIPAEGEMAVVTPFFEEPRARERMSFGDDVRPWHEHEDPFLRVKQIMADRGVGGKPIGLEDSVRYFVVEGLKAQSVAIANGRAVVDGCRMFKSTHELQLMHTANAVTLGAYNHVWNTLEAGMTPADINALMRGAQAKLGGKGIWTMALLAEASAYPHGTGAPQSLKNGDVVLMDCGCSVEGYQSDISRTFVFGDASKRQREVWQTMRRGQDVAFAAAKVGAPAGAVDDAVRAYYESLGYGPDYKTPGLSHRTGHGIGMDGHERVNFVRGETTPLAPGMCFSNEPGIYIYGEFGIRLEDCLYMTEAGPAWFTEPPSSIDEPIGRVAAVPR